jgi:hypothetical protein
MLERLDWDEFTRNVEAHVPALEKKEHDLLRELEKVRLELDMAREMKKIKARHAEYQQHGIADDPEPAPRPTESDVRESRTRGHTPANKPPRKQRILALLAQDPHRRWKARAVAVGLDDPNPKSVRVSLDEMARAGTVTKNPDVTYQYAPSREERSTF